MELINFPGEFVLCHCDMNELNLIITPDDRIRLIDYEYAGFTFPEVDIGFCLIECVFDYLVTDPPRFAVHTEDLP